MNGIVVEINNHTAAVLSDDGCVVKTRNYNYQIGQEVEISMKKQHNFKKVFAFASAATCILAMFGISAYAYYTPYTYVSLDVNPSIEYSVNRFDRVLSVTGVNDDGTEIINNIDLDNLENKSIEDAISLTVDEIADAGYLDSNAGGVAITTSSDDMDSAGELAETLETVVNNSVEENNHEATVIAQAVGANRVAEARELGVTPGKLNLVEKMLENAENADTISKEEWLHKSVKEIMAKTKEYKEINQEKEKNKGEETKNQEQNTNEIMNSETTVNVEDNKPSEDSKIGDTVNDSGSGTKSKTKSKSDIKPPHDSNAGAGAKSDADSNSVSETPNDSNVGSSNGSGSSSGSNSDSKAKNNSKGDSDSGSGAGSESGSDSGSGADNGSSTGSDNGSGSNSNSNKKGN